MVRNLGWTADELTIGSGARFSEHGHRLEDEKPDVVIAAFGFNESFAGSDGFGQVPKRSGQFHPRDHLTTYNGKSPPQLVLLSPIARESAAPLDARRQAEQPQSSTLHGRHGQAADKHGVLFVDLFGPSALMQSASQPLTSAASSR